ncbi:MAG TPA: GNAT family N-acetyltransferase [Herpetosiphon sp.]|uniref:GCN5-related N-acetyltransferase n=1 Tax=Herpetosiphon aurantiacus (strain ATCC 23779 / DSM 785 / 114-95) TaxID=316274 RepID=A9B5D8_HERA2|nr:GNAT family N-acetyltransferase [Herpetosiphon sp.]ABX02763.1 GCN5-related N-acetyltransferase [Herpetosiphon aurantiacus DSM 785]HBW49114.1 GNAT family N-acetyltransferase [Herpetosiphon sp.]
MQLELITSDQQPTFEHLLSTVGLGNEGLATAQAYGWWQDGKLQAGGALEIYGELGLLRSVAVRPDQQNQGLGAALLDALEQQARQLGLQTLYLLTTSAAKFFAAHGYQPIERAEADSRLHASVQWGSICSSATLMVKHLV